MDREGPASAAVQSTRRDKALGIEYRVWAYRPLSDEERDRAITHYLVSRGGTTRPGSRVNVYTDIGRDGD